MYIKQNMTSSLVWSQTYSSQLQTQNHKMKSVMANINFVINASSAAMANQLRSRLERVKVLWEPLSVRLKQRTEQLVFEKAQSVSDPPSSPHGFPSSSSLPPSLPPSPCRMPWSTSMRR